MINARLSLFIVACVRSPCMAQGCALVDTMKNALFYARLSLFIVVCVRSPCGGAGVRLSEGDDKRIDNARL